MRFLRSKRSRLERYKAFGIGLVVALSIVGVIGAVIASPPNAQATGDHSVAVPASPQVRTLINLHNSSLHPRQLAYDGGRNGIWFWTSTQETRTTFENRLYFYDIASRQLHSWPIYSRDWSSQLLAGLAVAPNEDVYIGWNHNLVVFHPATSTFSRYALPTHPRYPLPAAILGDLPADLGVADLAIAPDGLVWIARYGALSLTAFSPADQSFYEIPLPVAAGDPAKLAISRDGRIYFTTNLSANHAGYGGEVVGVYNPKSGSTTIYHQAAQSLVVTAQGDLYTALQGREFGLSRLSAREQAAATAQHRPAIFAQAALPFSLDDRALAADTAGRIWIGLGGQPGFAVLDPATGQVYQYYYSVPNVSIRPSHPYFPGPQYNQPIPASKTLTHVAAMVTDSQGHLWYVLEGSDIIGEVEA